MKTNTQVRRDVIAELSSELSVSAAHIDVEAKDGIVTLTGQVNSYANKWDAESAAQRVSGVKGLVVKMDVALSGSSNKIWRVSARDCGSSGSHKIPPLESSINSGNAAWRGCTTGTPLASASMTYRPKASP